MLTFRFHPSQCRFPSASLHQKLNYESLVAACPLVLLAQLINKCQSCRKLTRIRYSRLRTTLLPTDIKTRHMRMSLIMQTEPKGNTALVSHPLSPQSSSHLLILKHPRGSRGAQLAGKQSRGSNIIGQDTALNMVLDELCLLGCFLGGLRLEPAALN